MGFLQRSEALVETSQKVRVPLLRFGNDDGSVLAAAASSGKFGITSGGIASGGTKLIGEVSNGNSKTSTAKVTFVLPQNYVAASNFTINISQRVSAIRNTTASIDAACYKSNDQGGVGSDQVTTSAQTNNTTSWVVHSFAVTGTSFSPGDEIDLYIQAQANDSGGSTNGVSEVGGVYLLCSTQM